MTLYGEYLADNHRRTHKWYQYFPAYERHFERFRNRHITLFEIGIGEGGSLQQWRRYFGPFARIVGIDVASSCKHVEEDQVYVRIGSQEDTVFLTKLLAEFGDPDIVIDDGGHYQPHVRATFDILYPRVVKNGVYVIEDLHAAYFPDHGGGLRYEGSFIERAKSLVDEMHAEYTGGEQPRTELGDRTTSVHFYDSIVVLEVGEYRIKGHRTTGNPDLWRPDQQAQHPGPHDADPMQPLYVHFSRGPDDREKPPSAQTQNGRSIIRPASQAAPAEPDTARNRIRELESEIAMLRASTSWRITKPLRMIGKMIRSDPRAVN